MNNKILSLLFLFVIVFACSKVDPSDNAARLRIKLTNSPLLATSEENLVIREIKLHIQSIEISAVDSSAVTDVDWKALDFSGNEYNLLSITNGKSVQIVDQYFPANKTIKSIKITLGNNNKIVTPSGDKDLIVPEKAREIIISDINENLYANIISYIIIDVRAFITEENKNYFLNPKVRVYSEISGGSIRGKVGPAEAGAIVSVVKEPDTLFTFPEADGMFMFLGLKEGEWTIGVFANKNTGYKDSIFTDSVFARKITEIKPIQLVSNKQEP